VASGSVRSHIDNDAQYECDKVDAGTDPDTAEDCRTRRFSIDFALRFDDSDRSARIWPLLIEKPAPPVAASRSSRNTALPWTRRPGPIPSRIAATRRLRMKHLRRRGHRPSFPRNLESRDERTCHRLWRPRTRTGMEAGPVLRVTEVIVAPATPAPPAKTSAAT
jgi:hypothetical protein